MLANKSTCMTCFSVVSPVPSNVDSGCVVSKGGYGTSGPLLCAPQTNLVLVSLGTGAVIIQLLDS